MTAAAPEKSNVLTGSTESRIVYATANGVALTTVPSVGEKEGSFVGRLVGDIVRVGLLVGKADGVIADMVGLGEAVVGWAVGERAGVVVGRLVGESVGFTVGLDVGMPVG